MKSYDVTKPIEKTFSELGVWVSVLLDWKVFQGKDGAVFEEAQIGSMNIPILVSFRFHENFVAEMGPWSNLKSTALKQRKDLIWETIGREIHVAYSKNNSDEMISDGSYWVHKIFGF